ncbi:UDP-N-acetylmuramoyl-L-alanyl-D-glutamate--2,6-diaminopimelate ligase [Fibrobacterota bacterium]
MEKLDESPGLESIIMMLAGNLLKGAGIDISLERDREISDIQLDSRKVGRRSLFLAMKGSATDGSCFISEAISRGACLVLTDSHEKRQDDQVIYIQDLRKKAPFILNTFFGDPIARLQCTGVTGTNGKTTVARLAASVFQARGHKVISLGTIDNSIDGEFMPARLTTPDPVELMTLIQQGVQKGCDILVLEASSHALDQDRLSAISFSRAVFTNLTQDHLDYHKNFEDYFQAKKKLFADLLDGKGVAVINADSSYGRRLLEELSCSRFTFSQENRETAGPEVDLTLEHHEISLQGTKLKVMYRSREYTFMSKLIGRINLENLLAVIALGFSLDMTHEEIGRGIYAVRVPGRNEVIALPNGAIAMVDYAHTPDALKRVLSSVREIVPGSLVCVFGCGGDRDRSKRGIMGKTVEELSDLALVTSDNPRTEDPNDIIKEILGGFEHPEKTKVCPDRAGAIKMCLERLKPGDCGVIAGKGHEDYQIIGMEKRHFSDREQVMEWVKEQDAGVSRRPTSGGTMAGRGDQVSE